GFTCPSPSKKLTTASGITATANSPDPQARLLVTSGMSTYEMTPFTINGRRLSTAEVDADDGNAPCIGPPQLVMGV
ncbi:hypothetical protein ACFQ6N_41015, partial [Kitasatospora sp. NPDC056446]|uniref:hypothetical protein n=1 Tax=Kitasatospora sp. NPDC056446 TaxID=3345819 RepID=UPI0036A67596